MAGPWEKYATPSPEAAPKAGPWTKYSGRGDQPSLASPSQPDLDVVATTDDGGTVYRMEDGSLGFTSPGYATTDPARVAQIMAGATPTEITQNTIDQERIQKNPIAARGQKVVEGVPFIGSYLDDAVGLVAPEAGANMRNMSEAMDRQRPMESTALNVAGAVAGSVPAALAAAPTLAANAATNLGVRAMQGVALGATVGATEGVIYGAGKGTGGDRLDNAAEDGVLGALAGAGFGAAGPVLAHGIKSVMSSLKGSDVAVIRDQLSVSSAAARVIKNALDVGDMDEAVNALRRAGDDAVLADAGQPARELLDAAANSGGEAGYIARKAVDERTAAASAKMQQSLDKVLGKPVGRETGKSAVREGTKAARADAYNAAYGRPIDYSGGRGRLLEGLMRRVPGSAIKRANDLMRLEGVESGQILARVADDGSVTFERLPDVRQIDYITRALNDVADQADGQGRLGGTTDVGRATKALSRNIRNNLRAAVPEYGKALDVAADAISQVRATDLGYSVLRAATTREAVREGLKGASKGEREAAKQGLRSYIDDTLANVARTVTDPNVDAREGIKLIRDMSSRASLEKMRALLGPKQAQALADELDQQAVAFELRAALATNSKTAIRQEIQKSVADQTASGALETLASGQPVNAAKRFVQIFTGNTDEAQALRKSGIYEEIARALTQTRGRKAETALRHVQRAMRGQRVTEQQAAFIGNVLATSTVLAGGPQASRALSTK